MVASAVSGQGMPEVLRALQNIDHGLPAKMSLRLTAARRIVVKIGSALIVDPATAAPRTQWLHSVTEDIAALTARGTEVIVVSSGAISLARQKLEPDGGKTPPGGKTGGGGGRADPPGPGLVEIPSPPKASPPPSSSSPWPTPRTAAVTSTLAPP